MEVDVGLQSASIRDRVGLPIGMDDQCQRLHRIQQSEPSEEYEAVTECTSDAAKETLFSDADQSRPNEGP